MNSGSETPATATSAAASSGATTEAVIATATDPAAIARCFAVMRELRPHLADESEFAARVERQRAAGYKLTYLESEGAVRAVAGWRVTEHLAWGKTLYVDDLVTRGGDRSRNFGGQLFDWLVARAGELDCAQFHLDSGVQRFAAHRFYLRKRMEISSHHFALRLDV